MQYFTQITIICTFLYLITGGLVAISGTLLVTHALGGMDVGDKVAGGDEHEDAHHEGYHIEGDDDGNIDFDGSRLDIIGRGVELDHAGIALQQKQPQGDGVAQQQSATDDEHGKPKEHVADGLVARTEGFEHAYHGGALQYYNKEARHHGDSCHRQHQREDNPDIEVEQIEPLENLRINLLDGLGGIGSSIAVHGAVDAVDEERLGIIDATEIGDGDLGTRCLVGLPAVELHGGIKVYEAGGAVVLGKIGLIDTLDGKPAGAHPLLVDEIGKNLVATLDLKHIGHLARDEDVVAALLVGEAGNGAFHEVLVEEGGIVVGTYALEHDAQEVLVGLEYALLHGIALYVGHSGDVADDAHHGVVHLDGILFLVLQRHEVGHLDVGAEADDLVLDGMLEAEDYTHGDNHDRQTNGHTGYGYTHGRLGDLLSVAGIAVYLAGYVEWEIHGRKCGAWGYSSLSSRPG